jgi:hypothetical protein
MKPQDNDPLNSQDEAALQRLFTERERRDEAASPRYERIVRRPARAASGRRWVPATVGIFLLALVVLGIVWRHHQPAPSPALSPDRPTLTTWKAPTDFLLAVPGGELLDSTPAFPDPNLPSPGRS